MTRMIFGVMLIVACFELVAQVPSPAAPQTQTIAIVGGTVHIGNGEVINNGTVVFANGKITTVGAAATVPAGAVKVDATGKDVYPGLIAAASRIGLVEIDALRQTRDFNEVGSYNPNVRAIIAYNTDSRVTPTLRSNGILMAEIAPTGGQIAGTSSVVMLEGWNWEDAAYKQDIGIHISWPSMYRRTGWWAEPGPVKPNDKYAEQVQELVTYFKEAQAYAQLKKPEQANLKFEAMKPLFSGAGKVFIHVDGARELMNVIDFKNQLQLDLVVVGGEESWQVAELLATNKIPVVLRNVHSLPASPESDIDQPYKLASLLQSAGVLYALSIDGAWEQRNLPFMAGTAAANGLTKEQALAAITHNPAQILGIDKNVGTLEAGKDATLFISTGDVLDMRTSNVEVAYIQGKQIDLDNKQKMLNRKFSEKYNQE